MNHTREGRLRRGLLFAACLCVSLGIITLIRGLNRPTIASMRTFDIVHLLGTGANRGVALLAVGLSIGIRRQREASDVTPGTNDHPTPPTS